MTYLLHTRSKIIMGVTALGLIAASLSLVASSPMSEDEQRVREVVGLYFKGAEKSEASYFERAFDVENGHMKYVRTDSTGHQSIRTIPIAQAIAGWTSRPAEESWGKIHHVNLIDGKLAHATIEILFRGSVYVDVLALYKANDDWKIVNKTFVSRGPVEQSGE